MPEAIRIGDRLVGPGHPCYLIAEAGSNHDRDLPTALRLIDLAAEAGADAVKFQTYSAERIYARKTPMAGYLEGTSAVRPEEDLFELIRRIELPRDWQPTLAEHARARGIHFFSSPFDEQAVEELAALRVPALKIASFELTHHDLLRCAARTGIPLLLSTGMATLGEIEEALDVVRSTRDVPVALLHCVSTYPAPAAACNLAAMATMRAAFRVPVGFSDHTLGVAVPIGAAAMGADLLEKHYTYDRTRPGPDHPFAVEPGELRAIADGVRELQAARGDGRKRPAEAEAEMRQYRRSLFVARPLPRGHRLTREDVAVKRPALGIRPQDVQAVVGRVLLCDAEEDQPLRWEMLG